ncbi:MAG: ATP-binding protein, partial [Campylobacteraceae bacterium]|nr:ATP-binding protein [Campylobacteraceae bacterium]
MYWFIAEDRYYYSNEGLERLKSQFKLQKIYVLPTIDEVKGNIAENEVGFIAPYSPSSIGDNSNLKALFVTKYLPNKYGVLTSHEKIACVSDAQAMEERLGLSVIDSGYSLANIAGAQLLKNFTNNLIKAEKNGYRAKAILLAGIPGTGKTFFVKCFAGELKRKLVQLNLSLIMESNEPIYKLNTVFEYFDKRAKDAKAQGLTESYVILIDEIEKMIGNGSPGEKRMLGRLLTVM